MATWDELTKQHQADVTASFNASYPDLCDCCGEPMPRSDGNGTWLKWRRCYRCYVNQCSNYSVCRRREGVSG